MASLEQKTLLYPRNSKGLVGSVPGTGVQSPNIRTKDGPRAPITQKIITVFRFYARNWGQSPIYHFLLLHYYLFHKTSLTWFIDHLQVVHT